jgi:capsular polysaccharide biosynthesis protein
VPIVSAGTERPGVKYVAAIADPRIEASARLLPGIPQHAAWAEPYDPPPVSVFELEGATAIAPNLLVTADGGLLDDSTGFPPSALVQHEATRHRFLAAAGGRIALAEQWRRRVHLDAPVLYVAASPNYAEWLMGDAPRVAIACETSGHTILLHGDAHAFHIETLMRIGVRPERLRIADGRACVSLGGRTTFCSSTLLHHGPSPAGLRRLRQRFRPAPAADSPRRVYLSRSGVAGSRRIRNEPEVEGFLAKRGFAIVRPETLSVDEQARLAAGAEVIVGPYGANLANLVFAERATRVVVIATKHQPEFARLLAIIGVPLWHVVPRAIAVREARTYSESFEFEVDLPLLASALEA